MMSRLGNPQLSCDEVKQKGLEVSINEQHIVISND